MLKPHLEKILNSAEAVMLKAGRLLEDNFSNSSHIFHKHSNHYGIDLDKTCDDLIIDGLSKIIPESKFFTEERQDDLNSEFVWVVDAIEGTTNYSRKLPFFATQCALYYQQEPYLSIVYAPILNQLYKATKDHGSFLNNQPIRISSPENLDSSILSISKGTEKKDLIWWTKTTKKLIPHVRTMRHFGATGLELAFVASGILDIHINQGSSLYDYAPGAFLVTEAGGEVVTNPFLIAANLTIYQLVLERL